MKRREFIGLLGGAAVTWPAWAHAQRTAMPVVGFLRSSFSQSAVHLVRAFREGLAEHGYAEGQNVLLEFRWANEDTSRLKALAEELVARGVTVIVASGGVVAVAAAKA